MATPLRHIIMDIKTDLKQVFDDKIITDAQIAYWCIIIGNRLLSQHIDKRESGAFLSTFIVPVEESTVNINPNIVKHRKYITLPHSIFDFNMDGAIEYIAYYRDTTKPGCPPDFIRHTFMRTMPSKAELLNYTKREKPAPDNSYFYRVHDKIYLLGIECVNVKDIEIGIYMTIDPVTKIDIDAPFDFPEELIPILKRNVLDLGRFSLMLPEERVNDGKNDIGANKVPTNKIASVNDLNQGEQQ